MPLHENMTNPKEKTPMCLVNELARFNRIQPQYKLLDERGPAHSKVKLLNLPVDTTKWKLSVAFTVQFSICTSMYIPVYGLILAIRMHLGFYLTQASHQFALSWKLLGVNEVMWLREKYLQTKYNDPPY